MRRSRIAASRNRPPARANLRISRAARTASACGLEHSARRIVALASPANGVGWLQCRSKCARTGFSEKRVGWFSGSATVSICASGSASSRARQFDAVLFTLDQIESHDPAAAAATGSTQNARVSDSQHGARAASSEISCGVISAKPSSQSSAIRMGARAAGEERSVNRNIPCEVTPL